MPQPGLEFLSTPTAGFEKDESSLLMPEPVKAEMNPNLPALNPRTNFRYQPEQSSLNGIEHMKANAITPQGATSHEELTIEEALNAIDNSTILNQFAGGLGGEKQSNQAMVLDQHFRNELPPLLDKELSPPRLS